MNHLKGDCPNANPNSQEDCSICIPKKCEEEECVREKGHTGFHWDKELTMKDYSKKDHEHCFATENPPCGIKAKHRCCLCKEAVPNNQTVKDLIENIISGIESDNFYGKFPYIDDFRKALTEVSAASRREALREVKEDFDMNFIANLSPEAKKMAENWLKSKELQQDISNRGPDKVEIASAINHLQGYIESAKSLLK